MNRQRYEEVVEQLGAERIAIQNAKREGYTRGDVDLLKNFKDVAARVRVVCPCGCGHSFTIPPEAAWAVYFLKHVDAILSGMLQRHLQVAEPLLGRFSDLMNYSELGFALYSESSSPSDAQRQPVQLELPMPQE